MADSSRSEFKFPGIKKLLSVSMTHLFGISPSVCMVSCQPQKDPPSLFGKMQFIYKTTTVSFWDCKVDSGTIQRNESGLVVSFRIFDRRWRWKFGTISGKYNIRFPNEHIDKDTEKRPRELIKLLMEALGERGFDISAIPDDTRPFVNWDFSNPAQELARLCDTLGCRVTLNNKNQIIIRRLGVGRSLPEKRRLDGGFSLDSPEKPDSILIVGGQTVFQSLLLLEALGENPDGLDVPIDDLPYKPVAGWEKEIPTSFSGVIGTTSEERETNRQLALKTVYRKYRVVGQFDGKLDVPGLEKGAVKNIKQMLPLNGLLIDRQPEKNRKTEDSLPDYKRPYVMGAWWPENAIYRNTHIGTIYDGQFSLDVEKGMVEFNKPVYRLDTVEEEVPLPAPSMYVGTTTIKRMIHLPAKLFLMVSYTIEDRETRQRIRYSYEQSVGGKTTPSIVCQVSNRDEIMENYRATYAYTKTSVTGPNGQLELAVTDITLGDVKGNLADCDKKAKYFADALAQQYKDTKSTAYTFDGLYAFEIDGIVAQVSWEITADGVRTKASMNNEFDFDIPKYEDRRLFETLRNGRIDK